MGRMVKISARDMKALDAARKRVAKRPCKPDDVEKLEGIPSMRARTSVKVGDAVQLSLAGERMWVRVTETLPPVPTRSEVETPRRAARVLAKDCAYFRGTLANHPVDASCKFGDEISFSRRHILKIEPAKAGKRGGRAGQASGASLDGFGFFDDEGGPEPVVTPLHELSRSLGETSQMLSAERLIKPAGLAVLASPRVHHFFKNRAWAVEIATGANPEHAAAKLFKELVGKRALSASDPFMHDLTLYVLHGGGVLRVEPPAKAAAGPNLAEIKHKIVYRAQEFFGSGAVKEVAGGAGDYRMVIKPKGRFKGKFSEANVRGADLDTVSRDLDALIEKATKLYGAD